MACTCRLDDRGDLDDIDLDCALHGVPADRVEWIELARAALARSGHELREAEPAIARALLAQYERGLGERR